MHGSAYRGIRSALLFASGQGSEPAAPSPYPLCCFRRRSIGRSRGLGRLPSRLLSALARGEAAQVSLSRDKVCMRFCSWSSVLSRLFRRLFLEALQKAYDAAETAAHLSTHTALPQATRFLMMTLGLHFPVHGTASDAERHMHTTSQLQHGLLKCGVPTISYIAASGVGVRAIGGKLRL
jgi:hypothetical protein